MSNRITAGHITDYLDQNDDFDLEQFALRTLKECRIEALHGGTYVDPLTTKFRQFDIRATMRYNSESAIRMAIECKSLSPEFPLVLLRVPRPREESFHEVIEGPGRIGNSQVYGGPTSTRYAHESGPYRAYEPVAKSATQIRLDQKRLVGSDSATFDKWSQALSSAEHHFRQAYSEHMTGKTRMTFVMPILVVPDSTLWVVDYSEAGDRREPMPADDATLFVDRQYNVAIGGGMHSYIGHLHIFTKTGFKDWVAGVSDRSSSKFWYKIFDQASKKHSLR